jgi:signal transduction histidine kinase/CheY-like chemotaxis protein
MSVVGRISGHAGELVLVVEDSPTQAEQLRYILEKNHYRVTVATNGGAALAMIAEEAPALIISDIIMPEMDGYELCRRIKSTEGWYHIPVILLTALVDPQDIIRGLACGADNFITKPYNDGMFISRILDMLENRRFEQEPHALPGLEISFACQKYLITSGRRQILDLLLSTYETAIFKNSELIMARNEMHVINEQLEKLVAERTTDLAETVHTLQTEIAERKRAEKQIQRLNRLHTVLSATNQAIVHTKDPDSLFREFCRVAVEHGGFLLAWVGLVDKATGLLDIVASNGANGCLDGVRISVREDADELGPTVMAFREGTYYICNDLQNSSITRPWHETTRAYGFFSSASVALRRNNEVIGTLTLCAGEKDFFDTQQIELLKQMGTDVSFALDNIAREFRRKETELALLEETTERLRTAVVLREREQMLIQQNRLASMGEMIGNIAHQWRQPLNTLGIIVQQAPAIFKSGQLDKEFVNSSTNQSMELIQHMSHTIDVFRNFFKPDKEKVVFTLNEMVVNSMSIMEGSLGSLRISVEIDVQEDFELYSYPNEFLQVLINILANASDAFEERQIANPKVRITLSREDSMAVLTISDNAGGIPEGVLDKIFDPYFTTKGPQAGTGVGLFMSKTIIEKNMGGKLTARNIADGAEFRIEV